MSYVAANGKFIFLIFTVKLIMLRIIWPILATLSLMVCTFWIYQIGVCSTGYYDLIGISLPILVRTISGASAPVFTKNLSTLCLNLFFRTDLSAST
ncbi:hypothetical protein LINGRAHAP2_LOCUS28411 [Linum grandiflorum]